MKEDLTKELLARLDTLAAKLGVAVESIFALYVKQAPLEAANTVLLLVLALLFFVAMLYSAGKATLAASNSSTEGTFIGIATCTGIGCLMALIVSIYRATHMMAQLFNPEYWALQQILSQLN